MIEADRQAVRSQDFILHRRQGLSQYLQSLAEVVPSLGFAVVAPQQASQLGARHDLAWVKGEIGEQRLCLFARDRNVAFANFGKSKTA